MLASLSRVKEGTERRPRESLIMFEVDVRTEPLLVSSQGESRQTVFLVVAKCCDQGYKELLLCCCWPRSNRKTCFFGCCEQLIVVAKKRYET